ncbi:hypothetical protein SPRG_03675 [Saprolegnia parasitica CBS 223.65]|uniref:FYVE-type domain-containing protein n=1 Tax=Saprolegnia parasitica (strain CBS 223.65) TaxID=695850 RepID=A0A067CR98_SAPPC|nr:hypothetical protein SPRG_03675 [Saprolegnia parasitica CBS 223.65]KDO31755.1 hypothetical protein SPRG_03675 [Saprolegnia parasitica CBS 223.65]|eukprot:XP_012197635.1 hypothetical protein SPRG_03675 [Saprolegnia parasitica CBS 223.65]
MVCRPVSFVQDLNLLMMDRLMHREHWVDADERYQCHACFQYFHLDPKKHCYMCGEIVCGDCRTRLLIEGRYMNDVGAMAFHHGLTAKVCHPCYFTFFSARTVGFFEVEKHAMYDSRRMEDRYDADDDGVLWLQSLPTIQEKVAAKLAPIEATKKALRPSASEQRQFDQRFTNKVRSMTRHRR